MESIDKALNSIHSFPYWFRAELEKELVEISSENKQAEVEINRMGFVIYRSGSTPLLLDTLHSGVSVPPGFDSYISEKNRHEKEEDIFTADLYKSLFLSKGGYWLNTFVSRYAVDLNREANKAIFSYEKDHPKPNIKPDRRYNLYVQWAKTYHKIVYAGLDKLLAKSCFVFHGHSMEPIKDGIRRPDVEIICKDIRQAEFLKELLYGEACFNDIKVNHTFKYTDGYFSNYCDKMRIPNLALDINKALYLDDSLLCKSRNFPTIQKKVCSAANRFIDAVLKDSSVPR